MPLFSVVIPSHNRYERLRAAVASVLNQSFTDYELIVVDDGSNDNTPDIAVEYAGRLKYIWQQNLGVSSARNAGVEAGDSRYIAFLDSDDLWLPNKLEEQLRFTKQNSGFKISQCCEIWIRRGRRVNPGERHKKPEGFIFAQSLELCLISPSAVIMERSLLRDYGLFKNELPACEDYDLWLRITAHEKVGLLNENLVIRYGGHSDQLSARFWGMDRFRLYSVIKLLQNDANLSPAYKKQAVQSAKKRIEVLLKGAEKRNRSDFVSLLKNMLILLEDESYSSIDCRSLLER